jgi:hypothetical protein
MSATLPPGYVREPDGRLRPPALFPDAAHEEAFWRDGWFKVPMLDGAEVAELARRFAALAPSDRFDPTTVEGARSSYHCTFLDPDRGYRRRADELVREVFADRLEAVLPSYTIMSSNIYVKPPGQGRFEIHQNWPTIEELDIPTFTVWVPIQDTTFDNGTIRLVRGSHHIFPDVAAASSDRFFDDFETELIENYLEPVGVGAGEALVFDDSLLHWSGANRSSSPRVTFQIEMVPKDVPTVLWIRPDDDPEHFELWEVDKEYWIEYPFESVFGRPEGLPHRGRVANPNRRLSFAEFEAAMARHEEIRRARYALG